MNLMIEYWWDLTVVLTIRELKARYKSTFFGFLWAFANPLLQMVVLWLVFRFFFRIQVENYPFFLFSGLLPWMFFNLSLISGTNVFVENRDILKKVAFPKEILVLGAISANFVNFLVSIAIFVIVLLLGGFINLSNLAFLPIAILLQLVLTAGLVFLSSSLNVVFRDVFYIVQAGIILWFYLTPIFYPVSFVPERFLSVYFLNPMVGIISLYRYSFMGQYLSNWVVVAMSAFVSFLILIIGLVIFERRKRYIVDFV